MTGLLRLFAYGVILALGLSHTGLYFAPGDSLAPFRPELLFLTAVGVTILSQQRQWVGAGSGAILIIVGLVSILRFAGSPVVDAPDVTVRQHNLLVNNTQMDANIADILENAPDALTFQEAGPHQTRLVSALGPLYPYYQFCSYRTDTTAGSVAVMARDIGPKIDSGCAENIHMAWVTLDTDDGPVTFASLHMLWPWPKGQAEQAAFLEQAFGGLQRPVILGGDFNNVPWSAIARQISAASDTAVAPGLGSTFQIGGIWPRIRIDHVAGPTGATVEVTRGPKLGSDHYSLTAKIRFQGP